MRRGGLLKRSARWVAGIALILVGLVLSLPFVPGPGILLVVLGVFVLMPESPWLRRRYVRLRRRYPRVVGRVDRIVRRRRGRGPPRRDDRRAA